MARYRVRYGDVAEEQRSQLPHSVRTVFEARIEDLRRDPYLVGDYDKRQGWYSTTFGEMRPHLLRRLRQDRHCYCHSSLLAQVMDLPVPER